MVLAIALQVQALLVDGGIEAILTRNGGDVHMSNVQRALFANSSGAQVVIRIHCNGVRDSLRFAGRLVRGACTLTPARGTNTHPITMTSRSIAAHLHPRVVKATGTRDLGIQERSDLAGFNWSTVPCILLELGYLTNPRDEALLVSSRGQAALASSIADGIRCIPSSLLRS